MENQPPAPGRPKHTAVYVEGDPAKEKFKLALSAILKTEPQASKRIETGTHVIHLEPRMSATKLAEYAITDHARQETLAKNAKRASKAILIPYSCVRTVLPNAFTPDGLSAEFLRKSAEEALARPAENKWYADDNKRSADALKRIANLVDQIDCAKGMIVPRPAKGWGHVMISGVRVSVNAEFVFAVTQRGITKIGGVILNTGQNENLSLARSNGKQTVGDYLTVLLFRMIEQQLKSYGVPVHSKCYAIDIFRDKVYSAPGSHKTLMRHLEAACRTIAARWDAIPTEANVVEEEDEPLPF